MPPKPRDRSRAFFLVLAGLGLAALTIPIVYNLRQQLRPEQVAEARERWRRAAPADYDLKLFVLTNHDGREERDEFVTAVRGGKVALVGCNGELLYAAPALAVLAGPGLLAPPREDLRRHGVEALFRQIEEALREDQASGGRNYATAKFDPADGHPQHYVHRIRGSKERVEWLVRLERPRSP
jgi:hypothetical protein